MKNFTLMLIGILLFYTSCSENKDVLPTIPPITIIKNIVCQDVALEFKFEQELDATEPSSNSLKLTITNMSNISNTFISTGTPIVFCVNFFKENTAVLENLIALHSQKITSLDIGESIDTLISTNFIHEIVDSRIEVDIIQCKTLKNNFAGVYEGKFLLPKHKGGIHDTIPANTRCLISAEGKVKLWLEGKEENTGFKTQKIKGNITDNGLFAGTAYDIRENLVSYMTIDTNHIQLPNNFGDLDMKLYFSTSQIVYNSDTCTNLIFNLKEI